VAAALLAAITAAQTGWAQKRGGILRMYTPDSPASMSVPRGGDGLLAGPDVSMQSVVPDLATV
jgi:hypothetical protein